VRASFPAYGSSPHKAEIIRPSSVQQLRIFPNTLLEIIKIVSIIRVCSRDDLSMSANGGIRRKFQFDGSNFSVTDTIACVEQPLPHTTMGIVFSIEPSCRFPRALTLNHSIKCPKYHRIDTTEDFLGHHMTIVIRPPCNLTIERVD